VNEQQLAARMQAVVVDEPPLGFDPDEVVDGIHRRRRQRRLAFGSVGATAAVLAAVVAVVVAVVPHDRDTATDPNRADRPVRTCGDVDFDGNPARDFPDAARGIDRLDRKVPDILEEHIQRYDFEPVDGMRRYGCAPTLMGAYRAVDHDWYLSVRLSHAHDRLTPSDDRYDPNGRASKHGPNAGIMWEVTPHGARMRVYGYRDSFEGENFTFVTAATRLDPDGFVVELTLTNTRDQLTVGEMAALVADPDLRF